MKYEDQREAREIIISSLKVATRVFEGGKPFVINNTGFTNELINELFPGGQWKVICDLPEDISIY